MFDDESSEFQEAFQIGRPRLSGAHYQNDNFFKGENIRRRHQIGIALAEAVAVKLHLELTELGRPLLEESAQAFLGIIGCLRNRGSKGFREQAFAPGHVVDPRKRLNHQKI